MSAIAILFVRTDNATVVESFNPKGGRHMINRRNAAAVVVSLFAVVSTVTLTSTASASGPQPLPQAQAQSLIDAPGAAPSISATRPVSAREALAAASAPGAVVSVAPGMSLLQAVGLAPAVSLSAAPASVLGPVGATASSVGCSSNAVTASWGTWPYEQHLTDTTYWCAVYGDHITYTSSTTTATGTLCGTAWTTTQMISGGINYSWFVTRASAGWSCPTAIPFFSLHPSHHEDVSRNAWGSTSVVETG
jgi:hypothetical protein